MKSEGMLSMNTPQPSSSTSTLIPDSGTRREIDTRTKADISRCWTCGSCDSECPVNQATGRLRPQKALRLATLGQLNELMYLPEIWYCLTCRRCRQICPNSVQPSEVIAFARQKAVEKKVISVDALHGYQTLFARLQRVRSRAVVGCLQGDLDAISDRQWCKWLLSPVAESAKVITADQMDRRSEFYRSTTDISHTDACFTCGECSSSCPVSCERSVFDPRTIFRMVHLGLIEDMLNSPAIWLCIDCGRCTQACGQLVDGRQMIRRLKQLALEQSVIDSGFVYRVRRAERMVYGRWIDEVDALFGFSGEQPAADVTAANGYSACCRHYIETFAA